MSTLRAPARGAARSRSRFQRLADLLDVLLEPFDLCGSVGQSLVVVLELLVRGRLRHRSGLNMQVELRPDFLHV